MPSSFLKQVRQGRQFRADRLRKKKTKNTTTPCTIFLSAFPRTHYPLLPSFHLPRCQAVPPPCLHFLSCSLPAHCPVTLQSTTLQHSTAQRTRTEVRIKPRKLKTNSGGESRWLRCSFGCFIFIFILFSVLVLILIVVMLPLHSAKLSLFIEMRKYFILFFLALFCCHSENKFALTCISQAQSFVMFPLGLCRVSQSECKI